MKINLGKILIIYQIPIIVCEVPFKVKVCPVTRPFMTLAIGDSGETHMIFLF